MASMRCSTTQLTSRARPAWVIPQRRATPPHCDNWICANSAALEGNTSDAVSPTTAVAFRAARRALELLGRPRTDHNDRPSIRTAGDRDRLRRDPKAGGSPARSRRSSAARVSGGSIGAISPLASGASGSESSALKCAPSVAGLRARVSSTKCAVVVLSGDRIMDDDGSLLAWCEQLRGVRAQVSHAGRVGIVRPVQSRRLTTF